MTRVMTRQLDVAPVCASSQRLRIFRLSPVKAILKNQFAIEVKTSMRNPG